METDYVDLFGVAPPPPPSKGAKAKTPPMEMEAKRLREFFPVRESVRRNPGKVHKEMR